MGVMRAICSNEIRNAREEKEQPSIYCGKNFHLIFYVMHGSSPICFFDK